MIERAFLPLAASALFSISPVQHSVGSLGTGSSLQFDCINVRLTRLYSSRFAWLTRAIGMAFQQDVGEGLGWRP